jgi:hypothetical protein
MKKLAFKYTGKDDGSIGDERRRGARETEERERESHTSILKS